MIYQTRLRLTLAEDGRAGARIKVIGVGGGGGSAVRRSPASGGTGKRTGATSGPTP